MRGAFGWISIGAAVVLGIVERPPRVEVGQVVEAGGFRVALVAKLQGYPPGTGRGVIYDPDLISPKQVGFHPRGKVYINALFGEATVVYDWKRRRKLASIRHRFGPADRHLFVDIPWPEYRYLRQEPHVFRGFPVEMAFSHGGRYLWIPYYRRSYDPNGIGPSAVALVDTTRDAIVRVFSCGPVPKVVSVSADGRYLAVVHWGDNTVGFLDIQGDDPSRFRWIHRVVVESVFRPPTRPGTRWDRDLVCGLCLRGAVFSPDGRYLFVGRMHSGGIAVIDADRGRYLRTVWGVPDTPRHLLLSPEGRWLYVSSSWSGMVSRVDWTELVRAVHSRRTRVRVDRAVRVGRGVRTIALSPDGRYLYGAVFDEARLVVLRADTLERILSVPADPYPVGLAVSPDGREVWVTTQGRGGSGGHTVLVYRITTRSATASPRTGMTQSFDNNER